MATYRVKKDNFTLVGDPDRRAYHDEPEKYKLKPFETQTECVAKDIAREVGGRVVKVEEK